MALTLHKSMTIISIVVIIIVIIIAIIVITITIITVVILHNTYASSSSPCLLHPGPGCLCY